MSDLSFMVRVSVDGVRWSPWEHCVGITHDQFIADMVSYIHRRPIDSYQCFGKPPKELKILIQINDP